MNELWRACNARVGWLNKAQIDSIEVQRSPMVLKYYVDDMAGGGYSTSTENKFQTNTKRNVTNSAQSVLLLHKQVSKHALSQHR